ncbi:nucleoside 2-deoxyribosyltransferase [Mesorhizobium sp. BAC0120]|uniref:nucleoside 2-deoxyribosyltransferase n=1 Tax=Mesorhizobium sp. BAC0120 TaxID=3090670 RepID=UPI00298C092C|nr:nucleoside 2-deoxyribosyltransferase [Mesorhizobium sp. BAC0120]MDW6022853.1 nucleoside 2-deoxyribosyltransferase [Mesorhizobium sp. BAC0120]
MTLRRPRAYLAGPEVFLPNKAEVFAAKAALCHRYDIEPTPPIDAAALTPSDRLSRQIYLRNVKLMDAADLIIANLSPFRGPSADVGTVFELGYGFAKGLPVFGYSNHPRNYLDRAEAFFGPSTPGRDGQKYDRVGHAIEDFDLADNLMIDETLEGFGGVFRPTGGEPGDLSELSQFERCLAYAAEHLERLRENGSAE